MCGASSQQSQIANEQASNYSQLANNAQQIFGSSSQIFNDLNASFAPVVAAGPGQNGFTTPELAALKSQAITNTGTAYRNASQAAGERIAAAGGGNAVLPSGTSAAVEGNIATAGAQSTASALNNIDIQNAEVGRSNWLSAAGVLAGAPGVFNPATSAGSASTGAGSSAMSGATDVNNANNAWQGQLMGVLGDAAQIGSSFLTAGWGGGGGSSSVPGANGGDTYAGIPGQFGG